MDSQNKEMLGNKISELLCDLGNLDAGSEERSRAVKDLETLWKMSIESDKMDLDINKHEKELSESEKDRYIKLIIIGVEVLVPIAFYSVWMALGLNFEKTGCITSAVFKGLIHFFRPTK